MHYLGFYIFLEHHDQIAPSFVPKSQKVNGGAKRRHYLFGRGHPRISGAEHHITNFWVGRSWIYCKEILIYCCHSGIAP
jgi:hypothetical protein